MGFDLGAVFVTFKAKTEDFVRGIDAVRNGLHSAGEKVGSMAQTTLSNFQRMGSSILDFGKKAVFWFGTAAAAVTAFSVKSAGDYQQSRIALETMLGSADRAKQMLKELSDFAQRTPFNLPQVVDGAKSLLAYGIEADKIIPTFAMLGNIAAGVGKDKLPQLTLAFGQVRAATFLTGAELRQFTEAGVPLLEMLAKQSGKSAAQIKESMEKGARIPFSEVEKALASLTGEGGKFFNLLEKQSKTFGGTVSNVTDSLGRMARAIVGIDEEGNIIENSLFDRLSRAAMRLLEWLDKNKEKIIELGQAFLTKFFAAAEKTIEIISKVVGWFKENKWAVDLLIGVLAGGLIIAIIAVIATIGGFIAGIIALVGWVGVIVGAIVAAAVVIYRNWEQIKEFFSNLPEVIGGFFSQLWQTIVDWMTRTWQSAVQLAQAMFDGIVDFLSKLPERAAYWIGFMIGSTIRQLIELPGNLAEAAVAIWNFFTNLWSTSVRLTIEWFTNLVNAVSNFLVGLPGRIAGFAASIYNSSRELGKKAYDGFLDFFRTLPQRITEILTESVGKFKNFFSQAYEGAKKLATSFWNGFKNGLGIHSPSHIEEALMAITEQGMKTVNDMKGAISSLNRYAGGASSLTSQMVGANLAAPVLATMPGAAMPSIGPTGGGTAVHVHLEGANIIGTIPDDIAEKIGDGVIRVLQNNTRI